jgi:hypothetical protein
LAKRLLQDELDCKDIGQLKEYLGCKIDYDCTKGRMQITQPVLLQSFIDKFDLPDGAIPHTPAVPGSTLTKHPDDQLLDEKAASKYRSGVSKLLYMVKSRPEMKNAVHKLTKFSSAPMRAQDAMFHAMKYVVGTKPTRGLVLDPKGTWDGKDKNYKFVIAGRANSE